MSPPSVHSDRKPAVPVTPPHEQIKRLARLLGNREDRQRMRRRLENERAQTQAFLALGDKVTAALEQLNEQLFREILAVVEKQATIALQEVLEQPIHLKAVSNWQRDGASVQFHIEREGNVEDILRGQGGSVANVLSVTLRILALAMLDQKDHRPVLILDEQDCWLAPGIVHRLVKIIRDAGKQMGFQVLMISHHDIAIFEQYADKIYRLSPSADGRAVVHEVTSAPCTPDTHEK